MSYDERVRMAPLTCARCNREMKVVESSWDFYLMGPVHYAGCPPPQENTHEQ